ncbi:MAG: N-acetylmuramoyl-L-alanine amidase [Deltaproteobacteria bacterium]|nr:N-acetylmuramoyl-L-alanine amidase [Deltaproteobacteria bacterium]
MYLRIVAVCLGFLIAASSPVFGDEANLQFQRIRGDYSSLIKSTRDKRYRDNWLRIIDEFRRFSNDHPTHSKGPAALYMAGRACEELYRISLAERDALQAAELFDDLDVKFPDSSLADDALVLSAKIYDSILKDSQEAVSRYSRVVSAYPGGDQVKPASEALSRLSPYALEAALNPPSAAAPEEEVANEIKMKPAGPIRLTGIRSEARSGFSRVVLELSGPVEFSYNTLPGNAEKNVSPRLYVDLRETTRVTTIQSNKVVNDPILDQIRTGQARPDQVRVVLDLHVLQDFRVFPLDNPARLVIDVAAQKTAWQESNPALQPLAPQPDRISKILQETPLVKDPAVDFTATTQNSELKLIVVDPGHGGKDPGAIGPNGVKEKDVVLAIGKILAQRLKNDLQCKVVLTRDRDKFLTLEERTGLANRLNADLFISVHANASHSRKTRGIETYYLNFSKNEDAASVAARENGITLKEVSDLEMILFDLMANSKINESSLLANKVQNGVVRELSDKYSHVKDHGVRQGPFHVLVGATMPSILVEAAYISNHREEARLTSRAYQERVARGIVNGVRSFAATLDMVAKK